MSVTQLATAKAHSNIFFDDKDALLQGYLDAAEEYVAKFLNYEGDDGWADFVEEFEVADASPTALKPVIQELVLQMFDEFWTNKGPTVTGTSVAENPSWLRVAHLYRRNLGV